MKTTDRGANVKKAIAEENWINGQAHTLNLAVKEGFQEAWKKYAPLRRHQRRVKKLCRYVRKNGLQNAMALLHFGRKVVEEGLEGSYDDYDSTRSERPFEVHQGGLHV